DIADRTVDDVSQLSNYRHSETDWLASLLADHLELHHPLAAALPGGALPVAPVPDPVGEHKGIREDVHDHAEGGHVRGAIDAVVVLPAGALVIGGAEGDA